jgi:hypothetical protein
MSRRYVTVSVRARLLLPPFFARLRLNHVAAQRFVLAEMIKASHMDVGVLVDFVKQHDIRADWMSMQLPSGRFAVARRHLTRSKTP